MINVTSAFLNEVNNGSRNYLCYVDITLSDSTVLNLTNEDLWSGGVMIEDAVSQDTSLDLGSVVINKCTILLNNIDERFNEYEFYGALVHVDVGLMITATGLVERIHKGVFIVDDATYNGSLVTLTCLDRMSLFEKEYSESTLTYPATLQQILIDACTVCGVPLNSYTFPNYNMTALTKPTDSGLTFRNVVSWIAQMAGRNARINNVGQLELIWYDLDIITNITDEEIETLFDGGDLLAENGDYINTEDSYRIGLDASANYFEHLYSINTARYDTVITGVRVSVKNPDTSSSDPLMIFKSGTSGYEVSVESNNFINTANGQFIADYLGSMLIGRKYRKANFTHLGNPSCEAGDVAIIKDGKGRAYRVIVSSTTFTAGDKQSTVSAGETPVQNNSSQMDAKTANYVAAREAVTPAINEFDYRLQNSPGLYTTESIDETTGAKRFYLHNKPNLYESDIVWEMTAEAWGVSTDGGQTFNAGMTVDGDAIVRILSATGIDADWIKAGNISADLIQGGTLKIGGVDDINGVLEIYDSTGNLAGTWDKDSLNVGENFTVSSTGYVNIKSGQIRFGDITDRWMNIDSGGTTEGAGITTFTVTEGGDPYWLGKIRINPSDGLWDIYDNRYHVLRSGDFYPIGGVELNSYGSGTKSFVVHNSLIDDQAQSQTANRYQRGLEIFDKNDHPIAEMEGFQGAGGSIYAQFGAQRLINGTTYYNWIRCVIANDGTRSYAVQNPAAFRSALGFSYSSVGSMTYGINSSSRPWIRWTDASSNDYQFLVTATGLSYQKRSSGGSWDTNVFSLEGNDVVAKTQSTGVPVASGTDVVIMNSGSLSAGTYLIVAGCAFASSATGQRALYLTTNSAGGGAIQQGRIALPAVGQPRYQVCLLVNVSSATTYYLGVWQNSGSSLNVSAGYMNILKLHS